ncbi:MAG: hypothetical protein P8Y28_04285 [Gammaproteobacteria bacterium]|jgi:hypothetical protein
MMLMKAIPGIHLTGVRSKSNFVPDKIVKSEVYGCVYALCVQVSHQDMDLCPSGMSKATARERSFTSINVQLRY